MVDFEKDKKHTAPMEADATHLLHGVLNLIVDTVSMNIESYKDADIGGLLLPSDDGEVAFWVTVKKHSTDDMKWAFAAALQRKDARLAGVDFVDPFDEAAALCKRVDTLLLAVDLLREVQKDRWSCQKAVDTFLTEYDAAKAGE